MPRRGTEPGLRVGLIGSGRPGELYARALGQLEGVELAAACGVPSLNGRAGRSYPDAASLVDQAQIDAVVFASPSGDQHALLRRALLRRKQVLSTGPFALSAEQTERLTALALRANCLLMFGEERFLSPGFSFLERAAAISSGSTGPRYLRLLHVQGRGHRDGLPLGLLAVEDLAACLRLVRRTPRTVSAVGTKGAHGSVQAAFINMVFRGGTVASIQVSLSEAAETRQTVVALARRTFVLDDLDPHLPLRIMAEGGAAPAARVSGAEPPPDNGVWHMDSLTFAGEPFDGPLAQVRRFLDTLASPEGRDQKSNAELWARAAALWEAAEGSVALAGAPIPVDYWSAEESARRQRHPSHLRIIVGGRDETTSAGHNGKRPALRVHSS